MGTATFLKDVTQHGANGFSSVVSQKLYRLDPPLEGNALVVVSAVDIFHPFGGPETYIFPANEDGNSGAR
jgi:hypothetical protein